MKSIIYKINKNLFTIYLIYMFMFAFTFVNAQEKSYLAPDVNIISVTPLQGSGIDIDRVPGKVQTFDLEKIGKKKNFTITETLNREATGISLFNLNSSPMQNDINFRGYVGGPLLGTAQSIAVYQNGMRVNVSFGEVVQWDLVPDFAINSMQIITGGDPIFGQNALGGAITMEMKNGFNFQGANLTASGVNPNGGDLQNEAMRTGFVGTIAGIDLYQSSNITVDANDDAKGAVFAREAFAMAMKRDFNLEPERDASNRGFELNATAIYGVAELDDSYGVEMFFDAAI